MILMVMGLEASLELGSEDRKEDMERKRKNTEVTMRKRVRGLTEDVEGLPVSTRG